MPEPEVPTGTTNPPTTEENTAAAALAAAAASGAGGSATQLELEAKLKAAQAEAAQWQTRFTGMQGSFQKEQIAAKEAATRLAETNALIESLTSAKTAAETQLVTLKEGLDSKTTELEVANAQVERFTTVMQKYPQLLPFMDVLPDGVGEDFEKKLGVFAERLSVMGTDQMKDFKKMNMPPSPPPKEIGGEDLLKQAQAAMRAGNTEEYNKYYDQYLAFKKAATNL